ncbi:MAG: agmatine deiminase family protein [Deltaproteobacteria bacterium]|nr:agmatine deiminase family protein [Deltaproteobacteria bacterium]
MRVASPTGRLLAGTLFGAITSMIVVMVLGMRATDPTHRLVPEDASGQLRRIAIHYVPAMDHRILPVWKQLFAILPADVDVVVVVQRAEDFDRFTRQFAGRQFKPVVLGHSLTTWSRDRLAALDNDAVLAPPRVSVGSGPRAGDWEVPFAIARDIYDAKPAVSELVFEGGDLAASTSYVFADVNLIGRNLGRGDASRAYLERSLQRTFSQDVIWLGNNPGDVPEHHIMMYTVPLDDRRMLVGDVRLGKRLAPDAVADPAFEQHAARFDRVAIELISRGFTVARVPVVVLPGAGSYVTYTNALFDRDAAGPVVYLPTYRMRTLDRAAADLYTELGYRVVPIDVSTMFTLNGSLGCLVNVLARD